MIYVFDNASLSKLKHFYPDIFKSVWNGLDALVKEGLLISTKEVWREMQEGNSDQYTNKWLETRKEIFTTPNVKELQFVAEIFKIKHFQTLISEKSRLKGKPVADPFVIACAMIHAGTVVTEEKYKENAAKIPNICEYFKIPCMNLEQFMRAQRWMF